jgi:ribose/xylose/arabinose/galactoside ABC-type transport system permease subunit
MKVLARLSPIWLAVLLLYGLSGLVSPAMLSGNQVLNVMQVAAFLGLVAIGQTFALLVGGIDLSVGGVVTLTNIVSTSIMLGENGNILPAVAVCIGLGIVVGAVNGALVAYLRVAPLIATLAMNSMLFGAALVYTGGAPHGSIAGGFKWPGQGSLFGLPASTLCWLVAGFAVAFALRRTTFGRWIYAVGANKQAARLMGVPVAATLIGAYVASSVLAVFGGLLITSYIGNPSLGIGDQFLLTSVASVVVGGTTLTGGVGSVVATIGGALFMTELVSFTNIARVATGTQYIVQGALIALSVVVYRALDRRRRYL